MTILKASQKQIRLNNNKKILQQPGWAVAVLPGLRERDERPSPNFCFFGKSPRQTGIKQKACNVKQYDPFIRNSLENKKK